MTYSEAIDYIHSVCWKGSRPGLERISKLCDLLEHPEDSLKFIHVAGTNGKGSTSTMISSILTAQGYRVGLYTSPFVEIFNERIMFCGEHISDDDLATDTEYVKQFADTMEDSPTEFELITAIAFVYFKRMKCDFVVLECGLGGRLDSTNVIKTPVISIITGIDIDHTAILGNSTSEIAAEKAGIIKKGVPVVFGEGDSDVERVIREKADEMCSQYVRTDFSQIRCIRTELCGTTFDFGKRRNVKIGLRGLYQTRNAATVLTAVDMMRKNGITISDESIVRGLHSAEWKARFETLVSDPLVIYDGAHNLQGINAAVENISHYLSPLTDDGKIILLMGVMADKEHIDMIGTLSPYVKTVFSVTPDNARSLDSTDVEREFQAFGVDAQSFGTITYGVRAAMDCARHESRPLVCLGSLYMYADVKHAVLEYSAQKQEIERN